MKKIVCMAYGLTLLSMTPAAVSTALAAVRDPVGLPAAAITNKQWLNSAPLSLSKLKGNVVLVEFWTFGCYNCRNVEPYVKKWFDRYAGQGLVVIGVHTPEFEHEYKVENVKNYLRKQDIRYPIAIDNDFRTWTAYANRYWPAMYLIDKQGIIRYLKIGEGSYDRTETMIQTLLKEPAANQTGLPSISGKQ